MTTNGEWVKVARPTVGLRTRARRPVADWGVSLYEFYPSHVTETYAVVGGVTGNRFLLYQWEWFTWVPAEWDPEEWLTETKGSVDGKR